MIRQSAAVGWGTAVYGRRTVTTVIDGREVDRIRGFGLQLILLHFGDLLPQLDGALYF